MKRDTVDRSMRENLKETFANFIKSKKMRRTPERFAILDKALEQKTHFSIDSLYKDIESDYHVSRSTVYNTVELLCECNILRKYHLYETQAVYELAGSRNVHLVCLKCGAIKEMHDEKIDNIFSTLRFRGFHPSFFSINMYGTCSTCSRKLKKHKS